MDTFWILIPIGFLVGTFGTLIGAGGGFILIPLLIFTYPDMPPATTTAISIAIVAANAISGSFAYARSGRIDYKAGWTFGLFTIPGSILGVYVTELIPASAFRILFGVLLITIAVLLFIRRKERPNIIQKANFRHSWKQHCITDKKGEHFKYTYNQNYGIVISILVGFLSPMLGIGGGIIHVPAMVQWLQFPVYIATATSHFILAIMSTVSVLAHMAEGSYNDPFILRTVTGLAIGVIGGAQAGAYLSHKIPTKLIVRTLAVCLGLVGLRLFIQSVR